MSGSGSGPTPEDVLEEIGAEISRVHVESYGERAHDLKVSLHDDFIAVVMDVDLSRGERTLVDAGKTEQVKATREAFQDAIAETFIAIVERASGRRVSGFASRMVVDRSAPWSAEVFRLAPRAA